MCSKSLITFKIVMLYNLCGPKLCIVFRTATIIEKCIEKKKKRLNSCIPTWKFCLRDELVLLSSNLFNNTWWHLQYIIAYIKKRYNLLTSPTLLVYSISYFFFNYHPLPWRCCLFFIIVHCFKIFGFLCNIPNQRIWWQKLKKILIVLR